VKPPGDTILPYDSSMSFIFTLSLKTKGGQHNLEVRTEVFDTFSSPVLF
jgi:hypothetical protein